MKRFSDILTIDNMLIALVLLVTVARGGYVISAWDQPGLWAIGYLAALAVDMLILRFAFSWRRSSWRSWPWTFRLVVLSVFAIWSGGVQAVYMSKMAATWYEAVLLSFIWPVAICALSVNEAMTRRYDKPDTMPTQQPSLTVTRTETRKLTVRGQPRLPGAARDRTVALAGQHPEWTAADIAREIGRSERTVRRHLRGRV